MKQLLNKRKKMRGEKRPLSWKRVWYQTRLNFLMVVGAWLVAFGYAMFQVPYNIAAGGVSGVSIIVNHYMGWPVGLLYWLLNLPLLVLGFFYLGRWDFLVRTLVAS
ncbi:MAG: YitT family protein, partial [Anaerolineales bacterium]|nr:YitT family protein [Anaerolineales bacterium]